MFFALAVIPLLAAGAKAVANVVEYRQVLRETKEKKPQARVWVDTPIVLNEEELKEYQEASKAGDQRTLQRLRRRGELKNAFATKA